MDRYTAKRYTLALVFLVITVHVCIINPLTRYINYCLNAIKLMVIRAQYKKVPTRVNNLTQDLIQEGNQRVKVIF